MIWNGKILIIKEGQFVTGRKELSEQSGIPESTVEDILKYLENQHQIEQQKTTKYRLITILNWKEYQNPTSEATTKQQQSDTNKNDKNDKKLDSYRIEETEIKEKKVTPEMREVFSLFGENPARFVWKGRVHEREAAAVLHREFGMDELRRRKAVIQKHKNDPLCPQIDSPADFLAKMPKMETFLKNI